MQLCVAPMHQNSLAQCGGGRGVAWRGKWQVAEEWLDATWGVGRVGVGALCHLLQEGFISLPSLLFPAP